MCGGWDAQGVWTLDKQSSMEKYVDFGARSVMTNTPSKAVLVGNTKGFVRASPSYRPPRATSSKIVTSMPSASCDCNYRSGGGIFGGGCHVVKPAPPNRACRCKYMGAWTCKADVVPCADATATACKKPDKSVGACIQGGGDCGGYKGASD